MSFWWFYFLAKLTLYFRGTIPLDVLWNLLFLIFLLIPLPKNLRDRRLCRVAKAAVDGILGALLLWHDSYFPPLGDFITFLYREGLPEPVYLLQFLSGFFRPWFFAIAAILWLFCVVVRRYMTLTPVVILLLLVVPIREYGHAGEDVDGFLKNFYRSEADRVVSFPGGDSGSPEFDVIILHVCSLSKDDLKGAGMEQDPFWKGFDLLLSRFNTVTSYSNPSGIRLLRSKCGQSPHGDLYRDAPKDCYLLDGLRSAGYTTFAAFNHDGEYGHFREQLTRFGHIDPPMPLEGLPVVAYDFDGSKIFDDFAVLQQWWEWRQRSGVRRAALYYNTVILHDGAHQAGDPEWWKRDRVEQYRTFLGKLLTDFDRFFDRVASSERKALVLFVPEHGMALLGGPYQAPGLREIPLPRITEVPVGLRWIHGTGTTVPDPPLEYSGLTSYSALAFLIGGFLRDDASARGGDELPRLLKEIPTLPDVMENEKVRVVQRGDGYWVESRATGTRWAKLRAER